MPACSAGRRAASTRPRPSRPKASTGRSSTGIAQQDLALVAADPEARAIGQRLFLTYCAQCHGSDAGGGIGLSQPARQGLAVRRRAGSDQGRIMEGRNGVMPPLGAGARRRRRRAKEVANYVLSLCGAPARLAQGGVRQGEVRDVRGVPRRRRQGQSRQLGAPNLTDQIWLYGGSRERDRRNDHDGAQGPDAGAQGLSRRSEGASARRLRLQPVGRAGSRSGAEGVRPAAAPPKK